MNAAKQFKRSFTALVLTVLLVVPIFVSAAPSAGIKPDSFFYFLDLAFERMSVVFTFNSAKKAQKVLSYAEERIAEVQVMAEEKKPRAIDRAMKKYKTQISDAIKNAEKVRVVDESQELLNLVRENTSMHQEVLLEALIRAPEDAKGAIENAIEISKLGHEQAVKQIKRLARISHTCISRFDFSEIRTILGSLWVIRLPIAAVRAAMAVLTGLHTA